MLTAQVRPRLAILPFTGDNAEDAEAIARFFSYEPEINRNFTPVLRNSSIDNIMREQQFQRSGLTDADTISELGKMVNADYVLAGHITELGQSKLLLITIIHVEQLRQVAGDYREYQRIEETVNFLPDMARRIVAASQQDVSQLPRLAVLPFNAQSNSVNQRDAEVLAQILATEIANSGNYAVFPRTSTIERVMAEHRIQRSGFTDPENIRRIGVAVNAQYLLDANFNSLGMNRYFSAAIIHIESGEQGIGAWKQYQVVSDGLVMMAELASEITGVVTGRQTVQQRTVSSGQEIVVQGASLAEKLQWLQTNAASNTEYLIEITGNESIGPQMLSYSGRSNITIRIIGRDRERMLSLSANGSLFTVGEGVTLILDNNTTLLGRGNNTASVVRVNEKGTLIMNEGSRISGNTCTNGGGVYVAENGSFTMTGGEISYNTASNGMDSFGGGVYILNGNFIMTGGEIFSNNIVSNGRSSYGGGVYVSNGFFSMISGKIYENSTRSNTGSFGGGVFLHNGIFIMTGGEISGHRASSGGGVFINNNSEYSMEGGIIFGNISDDGGGGIYVSENANFIMTNGEIFGNNARASWGGGGGVYIAVNGFFSKSGGTIHGFTGDSNSNNAYSINNGHAVYVAGSQVKRRNTTAGPRVNLDSTRTGAAGGWE